MSTFFRNLSFILAFVFCLGFDVALKQWSAQTFQKELAPMEKTSFFNQTKGQNHFNFDAARKESSFEFSQYKVVLQTSYARNPASAWGLLSSVPSNMKLFVFAGVSLFGCLLFQFLVKFFTRNAHGRSDFLLMLSSWAFAAGITGNLLDRLRFGFVVDIWRIQIQKFAHKNIDAQGSWERALSTPFANFADIVICLCVLFLCLRLPLFFGKLAKN